MDVGEKQPAGTSRSLHLHLQVALQHEVLLDPRHLCGEDQALRVFLRVLAAWSLCTSSFLFLFGAAKFEPL